MASYREENISDINGYVSLVDRIKTESELAGNHADLLFRGQREDEPLVPKLGRLELKGKIKNIEKLMLEEFKRASYPLSEFDAEDGWDLLALAQHHGLPTRLLDWTYSALAGLWFTVNRPPAKNKKNKAVSGVVWILVPEVTDFRTNVEKLDPLSNKITKIYRSKVVSKRISAQAGAFTVHRINDSGKFYRFETVKAFSKKLVKVTVPPESFSNIRQRLHMLGVNNSTLFPDIDGLCSHLKWRYSKLDDEK